LNNGTDENGASYSSPDFSGQGKALNLDRRQNQYVRLPHSLNLGVNTSFTVGVWIFLTGANSEVILSDCNAYNPICIDFVVYNIFVFARIWHWNSKKELPWVRGEVWRVICQSCWIHLAFTFNQKSNMLAIYFNGLQMKNKTIALSTSTTTGNNENKVSYIGYGSVPADRDPFDGLIDQLSISYFIKTDSEILDEATLLCHYNFETDDINIDSGPNDITAYSENVNRSLTNNQSSLAFNSNDSYFQSSGFTLLMSKFYEFSIAFWVRPVIMKYDALNSAIAIFQLVSKVQQVSSASYVCFTSLYIANASTNRPYFQYSYGQLNMYSIVENFILPNDTWTHVGISYLNASLIYFYINGKNHGGIIDSRFSLLLYNPRLALTIGGEYFNDIMTTQLSNSESRKCFTETPVFNYTQLHGEIDDVRVYARALTKAEFATIGRKKN
jgi:hypothetical protein